MVTLKLKEMKEIKRDLDKMTAFAKNCGMKPYVNRMGEIEPWLYVLDGYYYASVDLSACAYDEKSILRTALKQLTEVVDENYNNFIEMDLCD